MSTQEKEGESKELKALWQRTWRQGKLPITMFLTHDEVDVLDWFAYRLLRGDRKSHEVVGRPAALRALLATLADEHKDAIVRWKRNAPAPDERGVFFKEELGRRRRGTFYETYQHLSREEQQQRVRKMRGKRTSSDEDEEQG